MHPQINFRRRSYQKELLDNDAIPFDDIRMNMEEINTINKFLGGHRITLDGFKKLTKGKKKFMYVKLVVAMEIIFLLLQTGVKKIM